MHICELFLTINSVISLTHLLNPEMTAMNNFKLLKIFTHSITFSTSSHHFLIPKRLTHSLFHQLHLLLLFIEDAYSHIHSFTHSSSVPPTEEAVNDVKRQAMIELQKALSAADQKAMELLSSERSKHERSLSETRKQTQDEMMRTFSQQEESLEVSGLL